MSSSEADELSDSGYDPDEEYAFQWPRENNATKSNTSASEESENESENEANDSETTSETSSSVLTRLARKYILEIYEILDSRGEANLKNALELNKEMQNKLIMIRTQVRTLHGKILCRYAQNEERLVDNMSIKKSRKRGGVFGKRIKGRTFYIRGNTFFKDENHRNCPNNEDYISRCKKGEIFPMDFDLVARHIWSITDKMGIVRGIKEQIIAENTLRKRISSKNAQLTTLLECVGKEFKIDWAQISKHNMMFRHSPTSCKAMWDVYLQPALKHDNFSAAENERLQQVVQNYNFQNWAAIAREVGKRSDYQCFLQYYTTLFCRNRSQRWDKRDDKQLLDAIEAAKCNGVINWSQVAFQFPQKSKASLQQRYQYAINPSFTHEPFSPEEDLLLLAAVKEYGTNFAKFPRTLFPNRSVIQLRSRYQNTLQNRHKITPWTLEDDKFLMEFVTINGTSSWKKLEDAFENRHTRISCRQRYHVIQRNLSKDSNTTLEQIARKNCCFRRSDVTTTNWQEKVEEMRTSSTDKTEAGASKSKKRKNTSTKREKRTADKKLKILIEVENGNAIEGVQGEAAAVQYEEMEIAVDAVNGAPTEIVSTTDMFGFGKKSNAVNKKLETRNNRQTKKPIYIERLRANGLRFHDFLKYSCNFQFGRVSWLSSMKYMEEIEVAKSCLGFQMPKGLNDELFTSRLDEERNTNGLCSPESRRQNLRIFIRNSIEPGSTLEPTDSQVPPNFSTLATLRALCVLSADYAKGKEKASKATAVENNSETLVPIATQNSVPIERFRKRFRNLLYQAAVLSRLPPSSLENESLMNNSTKPTEFYRSAPDRTVRVPSPVENHVIVKTEVNDEVEPHAYVIKNEIDIGLYKGTNQGNKYS